MTRAFVIAAFVLTAPAFATTRPARQNKGDTGKALVQVMKLEGRWARAVVRRDVKALGRILADDYTGSDSGGTVRNKAQTSAELKSAPVPVESLTPYDFGVEIDGDAATVNARATIKLRLEGQVVSRTFSYTRHYVRRKGRWLVPESHTSGEGDDGGGRWTGQDLPRSGGAGKLLGTEVYPRFVSPQGAGSPAGTLNFLVRARPRPPRA